MRVPIDLVVLAYVIACPFLIRRNLPTLCVFRLLSGSPCPACGLTHAYAALLAGHLRESLRSHVFAVPVLIAVLLDLLVQARLMGRFNKQVMVERL